MKPRVPYVMVLVVALIAFAPCSMAVPPTPHTPSPLAAPGKAVADARVGVEKAKAQLLVIRKRLIATYEIKPEWKAAKADVDQSKTAFDAAAHKLSTTLEKSSDYQALVAKRDKAQKVLESSNKVGQPGADDAVKLSDEEISAASKDRTEAGLALKKLEKETQDNDPAYIAARQKYLDAKQAYDSLQSQVDDAVKADPEYEPTQLAIEQAELQYKQAREAYAQAAKSNADSLAASKSTPTHTPSRSSSGR